MYRKRCSRWGTSLNTNKVCNFNPRCLSVEFLFKFILYAKEYYYIRLSHKYNCVNMTHFKNFHPIIHSEQNLLRFLYFYFMLVINNVDLCV